MKDTLGNTFGGLSYELGYSSTADSERDKKAEYLHAHLPIDLVSGLSALTYKYPQLKQQVLDALSPFQIISKQWACSVLNSVLADSYPRSPFVYFGSWFGQLNSIMSRRIPGYGQRRVTLVDLDPLACEAARDLLAADVWQKATKGSVSVVCGDALNFDLSAYAEEQGAEPIVVWTGIEHFDREKVKDYIRDHEDCSALYLLQGTNMPADDHIHLIKECYDLEEYFDGDLIYSAQIRTAVGDRFQTIFAT